MLCIIMIMTSIKIKKAFEMPANVCAKCGQEFKPFSQHQEYKNLFGLNVCVTCVVTGRVRI